jgi:uncharacterized protein (DUF362 family)
MQERDSDSNIEGNLGDIPAGLEGEGSQPDTPEAGTDSNIEAGAEADYAKTGSVDISGDQPQGDLTDHGSGSPSAEQLQAIVQEVQETEKPPEEENKLKEAEAKLESMISSAGSVDEVKSAITEFNHDLRGPHVKFKPDVVCALIDKLQQEGAYWATFIPEQYGILAALKRILAPSIPGIARLRLGQETQVVQEIQAPEERQEIFREIDKEPVYVEHGEGRMGNLQRAFDGFAEGHQELLDGIKGKRVLIKINAVDPSNPEACTSTETLKAMVENLLHYEPAEICIGDQPAGMFMKDDSGRPIDSEELFRRLKEQLGYDFLDQYPTARFIDFRSELSVSTPATKEDAKMYDLSGFESVFVLSLPKAHGQAGFSGCRKNLVGLLPQDEREAILHPKGTQPIKHWKKNNTAGLQRISESYAARNPNTVYVLDGYETMMGHEHDGIPRVTDYAMVSMDPFTADYMASTISFSPDVTRKIGYLHRMPTAIRPRMKDKVEGNVPDPGDKSFGESRIVAFKLIHKDDGTYSAYHEAVIDPKIDEIKVKPIEELIDKANNIDEIPDVGSVINGLGMVGSDRAISCLLRIADLTDDKKTLKDIYTYIHFPIVSSRGLINTDYSDETADPSVVATDELVTRYLALERKAYG